MGELVAAGAALGVAGIDPAGLLVALGALAAGVRARTVLGFTALVVVGTTLLGTVLTLALGRRLDGLDWTSLLPPDWLGALVEGLLAVGLLAWFAARIRRPSVRPPRPRGPSRGGAALLGTGAIFAASAPLDPTFLGLVVVAGRDGSASEVALAHLVWIVVSQLPLVVLASAVVLGRHRGAVTWVQGLLPRLRPALARTGAVVLALTGAVLAVDVGWWVVTGRFLLPDPA